MKNLTEPELEDYDLKTDNLEDGLLKVRENGCQKNLDKSKCKNCENIIIKKLNSKEVMSSLNEMFEIISTNMENIIDTGNSKEENYKNWKTAMIKELENNNKRWIAAYENNKLIGYFLYKIGSDFINIDEIQIIKEHQGDKYTLIKLLKYLFKEKQVDNCLNVTAYVNKNNKKCQAILVKKFGFEILEEKERGIKYINKFQHFKEVLEQYVIE